MNIGKERGQTDFLIQHPTKRFPVEEFKMLTIAEKNIEPEAINLKIQNSNEVGTFVE